MKLWHLLLSVAIGLGLWGNLLHGQESSIALFDGQSFSGWEGDTESTWRIEDGVIVAGSTQSAAARNEFLCTKQTFSDFELTLEFKISGTDKLNAGVQFRTAIADADEQGSTSRQQFHEVVGYQADIGTGYHGCLYDESRRRKVLARPEPTVDAQVAAAIPEDGWQTYRIRAVGNRIQLWLNGIQTVDYTETDTLIDDSGIIALQIHGGMVGTIAYRNIRVRNLVRGDAATKIEDMAWIAGRWTGEALGGKFEETWNPPLGGEMVGMFKLVRDQEVMFYELLTIVPNDAGDGWVLRLKHFNKGLKGWEEKDESVEFPLLSASATRLEFKGLTFSRESNQDNDKLLIEVASEPGESPLVFRCQRGPLGDK